MNADIVVAATIACEVPPYPEHDFGSEAIQRAIEAVCGVIRNRVASPLYPDTAVEVVLQPKQFSCVRGKLWPKALAGLWHPAHVEHCLQVWQTLREPSLVDSATHYYSPVSMVPQWSPPFWAATMREVLVPGIPTEWFRWFAPVGR